MKKISIIKLGEISADVAFLQKILQAMDMGFQIDPAEIREQKAGDTTMMAIRSLQRKFQIPVNDTLLVDQPTADLLNSLMNGQATVDVECFVTGQVICNGQPLQRVEVAAFDQDIPSKRTARQPLGKPAITDNEGNYFIEYTSDEFKRADRKTADLVLVVTGNGRVMHETKVNYNADVKTTINISFDLVDETLIEFSDYINTLVPLLDQEVPMDALTDADIEFLTNETRIPADRLVFLATASHWEQSIFKLQVPAEVLYGILRQSFPTAFSSWSQYTEQQLNEAIKASISQRIIQAFTDDDIKRYVQMIMQRAIAELQQQPVRVGESSLGAILGTVIADTNLQADFLKLYHDMKDDTDKFWTTLAETPAFKDTAPSLKLAVQLASLTNNNVPVMQAIQRRNIQSIDELINLDAPAWSSLLKESSATIPDHITGQGEEKLNNYAISMMAMMEQQFPTQFVAKSIRPLRGVNLSSIKDSLDEPIKAADLASIDIDELKWKGDEATIKKAKDELANLQKEILAYPDYAKQLSGNDPFNGQEVQLINNNFRGEVDRFLSGAKNFSFTGNPVDVYLRSDDGKAALEQVQNKEAVIGQVKRMQRMYNVSGDSASMNTLLDAGIHSSWQIASMPAGQYMRLMDGKMSTQQILATQARAASITENVVMSYHEMHDYGKATLPQAIIGSDFAESVVQDVPDYQKLFGSFDLCECGHCKSVYSATAYFVSLLHDLLGGKYLNKKPSLSKPIKELFKRRPDLKYLKLTCANTETEIPYIDLVNEILETYVAFEKLDEAHTRDTSAFTAEELAANPQFIIDEAYQKLSEAIYPASLPFDLSLETARQFLEYLGSSRYVVQDTFDKNDFVAPPPGIAAERMHLSAKEYEVLTQRDFAGAIQPHEPWKLYGYAIASPLGAAARVRMADKFIKRTNIKYTDLVALLKTNFINPHWQVAMYLEDASIEDDPVKKAERDAFIADPANAQLLADTNAQTIVLSAPVAKQCDLTKTEILYRNGSAVSDDDFARMNRFIRLWKKAGCTMSELDVLLTALSDGQPAVFNAQTITRLSSALGIKEKLNIPIVNLATLWGNIDTKSEKSLYEKLFLSKAALKIDDDLQLNIEKTGLKQSGVLLLINLHIPVLLAAFRVSETDLDLIRKQAGLENVSSTLTLDSISRMYRHAVLAKALKLSVPDLIGILSLVPSIDPFASPFQAERFADLVANIKSSSFKVPQLVYMYRHKMPDALRYEPALTVMLNLAKTIRDGLAKIDADNVVPETPDSQDLSQKLGKIFDIALVGQVIGTIDETFVYSADLAALPAPIPDDLSNKCSYDTQAMSLRCRGVLTPAQRTALESIAPGDATFMAAVAALYDAPGIFFNTMLYGFLSAANVQEILYQQPLPTGEVLTTDEQKIAWFEKYLVPFLKDRLSSIFIRQTAGDMLRMETAVTEALFTQVLPDLEKILKALKNGGVDGEYFDNPDLTAPVMSRIDQQVNFDWGATSPDPATIGVGTFSIRWTGKLVSPSTEEFTFYTETDDGVRLWINDQLVIDQWIDQNLAEHSGKVKLKSGQFYDIRMEYYQNGGSATARLKWSSPTVPKAFIPAENLFASSLVTSLTSNYVLAAKIASFIAGFGLKADEISHFTANAADFDNFNLAGIPVSESAVYNEEPFTQWRRIYDYVAMRNSLPTTEQHNLIAVFKAANGDFNTLLDNVKNATGWNEAALSSLMGNAFGAGYFNAPPAAYRNEIFLKKMHGCVQLESALGISVQKLGNWAIGAPDTAQAMDIKNTVRARYEDADWLTVAKEVNNKLRTMQRDGLVNYLLALQKIQDLGIDNANDLYQYFLIDVEMDSCMLTSRIVQANASVQLFAQRCLLNLEKGVSPSAIDADHWEWMKKYRVWEANRKVFLYPENWIEPELRDEKSPFFKDLESELLQGEVTDENAEEALKNYLIKLDTVARLDIRGMYEDDDSETVHVFGRTFNVPHVYYYRTYKTNTKVWSPWEKVQADIEGDHLLPVVWNRRLYLFWTVFTEKSLPLSPSEKLSGADPQKYYEIKIAWSEYKQKAWKPKMMSDTFINTWPGLEGFKWTVKEMITLRSIVTAKQLRIRFFCATLGYYQSPMGQFIFDGCNSLPILSKFTFGQPPLVHLTGTYMRNMAFEETSEITSAPSNNNKLILFKGTLPNTWVPEPEYDKARTLISVLRLTPGTFQVVAPSQGLQYEIDRPFFYQDRDRTFYVSPYTYLTSRPGEGPKTGATSKLPDHELHTPYIPWRDDPRPSDVSIGWSDPIPFTMHGAPAFDTETKLNAYTMPAEEPTVVARVAGNGRASAVSTADAGAVAVSAKYNHVSVAVVDKFKWTDLQFKQAFRFETFYHSYVCPFMKSLNQKGINGLLSVPNQRKGELSPQYKPIADSATIFNESYQPEPIVGSPYPHELVDFSESGAYSLYNWELFFHVPMLIANRLSKNQRFEEAMRWYHFIFNPTTVSTENSPKRYWQLLEFKKTPKESIQQLLNKLQLPDGSPAKEALKNQIDAWKDNPFNPHLIARKRPIAYMKNVVMKYLDNLIAWGDYLFRQDTMESVTEATQIYVLAAELLGKRKEPVPPRVKSKAETYDSLRPNLDEFENAMVSMETLFPYYSTSSVSNGINSQVGKLTNTVQSAYFCIPDNDKLLGYWDIVEDRLFKIRHCQNIEGVERKLSLFEPPIDPALLVQAVAKGISIGSVLSDISAALPNYRFTYVLQKAKEYTDELKSLAAALATALEKKDAEELSMIRATQETSMLTLTKEIKKMQYDEAVQSRDNIMRTRDTSVQRWKHYKILLGEENPQDPAIGSTIGEATLPQNQGSSVDGQKVSSYEQQDLSKSKDAASSQSTAGDFEMWSSIAHVVPNFNIEPWGLGTTFGGSNVGSALAAVAGSYSTDASASTNDAVRASKLGGYFRREQDWVLQCNQAAREIMAIDKQLEAAATRIDIAAKERENHDTQIENAKRIEEVLRNKYTNEELYTWMQGEIATVFFQAYQMAYDLARKAEKCYRFERGVSNSNFIQFGYWDSFRKGLMSGERLSLALKQLERAYMDQNKREYEISKHVSLKQFAPDALVQLKEKGVCEIMLPEYFFDFDYPGHYMRRIRSVGISIPCVAGPYTSINCTLTLLSSETRIDNTGDYEKKEEDGRFIVNYGALQSIATSNGQNDNGMFELDFRDERYLPFEGHGVISRWRIDMPVSNNQFDFNTIADVILHFKYTSREGGNALRAKTNAFMNANLPKGGVRLFSLRHDFPNEWHKFMIQPDAGVLQSFEAQLLDNHFAYQFKGKISNMSFGDIQLIVVPQDGIVTNPQHPKFGNVAVSTQAQIAEGRIIVDETVVTSLPATVKKNGANRLDQSKVKDVFILFGYNI